MYSTIKSISYLNDCFLKGTEDMHSKHKDDCKKIPKNTDNQLQYLNADPNNPLNCLTHTMNKNLSNKK